MSGETYYRISELAQDLRSLIDVFLSVLIEKQIS